MRHNLAIEILPAAVICAGTPQLSAQDLVPFDWRPYLVPNSQTIYDVGNSVRWPADANLAGKILHDGTDFRFGLPLCDPLVAQPQYPA